MATETEKTPAIVGYRLWRLSPNGFLMSEVRPYVWPPLEPAEGDSRSEQGGIYAFSEPTPTVNFWPGSAYGEVWLWGVVARHTQGYRAQFAYPKEVNILYETAEWTEIALATRYKVPITRATQQPAAPRWFAPQMIARVSWLTIEVAHLRDNKALSWLTFLSNIETRGLQLFNKIPNRKFLVEMPDQPRQYMSWPQLHALIKVIRPQ